MRHPEGAFGMAGTRPFSKAFIVTTLLAARNGDESVFLQTEHCFLWDAQQIAQPDVLGQFLTYVSDIAIDSRNCSLVGSRQFSRLMLRPAVTMSCAALS